jgi:hypothetical protein
MVLPLAELVSDDSRVRFAAAGGVGGYLSVGNLLKRLETAHMVELEVQLIFIF